MEAMPTELKTTHTWSTYEISDMAWKGSCKELTGHVHAPSILVDCSLALRTFLGDLRNNFLALLASTCHSLPYSFIILIASLSIMPANIVSSTGDKATCAAGKDRLR